MLDPPGSPAILYTLHTPPKSIGEVADDVHAGELPLSHLSPVIDRAKEAVEPLVAHAVAARNAAWTARTSDGCKMPNFGVCP